MLRLAAACAFALICLGAAGCAVAGSEKGAAQLLVTRDFGKQPMVAVSEDPIESGETAIRILMRNARVKTRYGGRFVNAVNGFASANSGGTRRDWFYYVNGIEADVGGAEHKLDGGDRIWWDYHDWSDVMRVPAVVGSFPEPFLHGSEGKRYPIRIDCGQDDRSACSDVANRLEDAAIAPSTSAIGAPAGKEVLRVVVGKWDEVRQDGASEQIEEGPAKSGVFARFGAAGDGGYELDLLDSHARVIQTLGPGAGLVAATRFEDQAPTWVVAGTDATGLERAISLLRERILRSRFAVATTTGAPIALPVGAPR
jgi:Domain of unknown function (DUF4430)